MKDALVAKRQKGRPKKESTEKSLIDTRDMKQKAHDLFLQTESVFECYKQAGSTVMNDFLSHYPTPIPFHLFRYLSQREMIQFCAFNEKNEIVQKGDLVFFYDKNIFKVSLIFDFNKNNGVLYAYDAHMELFRLEKWYCLGRISC